MARRPMLLAIAIAVAGIAAIAGDARADATPIVHWQFHLGDDPRWAAPELDDRSDRGWESVDLTPPHGARDGDVGLVGFVPGWSARGHRGYAGYAWYRARVAPAVSTGLDLPLAIAGPPAYDSAYQLFVDGALVGGAGDFASDPPIAYGNQPRLFELPAGAAPHVIAVRVWMGAWGLPAPDGGGMHIAPLIGPRDEVIARYDRQWLQTIAGYIVDAVEPLLFVVIALLAWSTRARRLAIALLVLAALRVNQVVFFWLQIESFHGFELVSVVVLAPLVLWAWTRAWAAWLGVAHIRWLRWTPAVLAALLAGAQLLSRSWFHDAFAGWLVDALHETVIVARLGFVLVTAVLIGVAVRRRAWHALIALVLIAIGLFAQELSQLGIPGIWFPWGTGVSRTQFAYVAADAALLSLVLRRYRSRPTQV